MLNESEKVVRDPYGDFDTTGAWSYFVPREARDVNVTFRWWFPTSSEHWPSTPLIVPAGYAGDVPGERLGDANLTVVCHGLPPRLRSRADALVYSLLKRRPEGALLEVEWNIVSGCEYASAVRSDVYYCPPLKGPTEITLYQQAAGDSRLVARALSRALTGLSFDHGYDLARVHLLGFGVGAHVVGFVASDLHVISEFGRLTLLDPAAPLFVEKLGLAHLNASGRARVSEAVHTSAAEACGLGIANRLADLDVFVDGGERQPQCHPNYLCSHIWALYYYTRTVERCTGGGVSETGLLPGYWTPEKRGVYNVSMRKLACPAVGASAPSLGSEQSSRAAPMCVQCLYAWSLVALAFFAAPR
ncbi:hypothetical protein V5799_031645 [Amblyomma americanum]|uniref:Lipase domain-containing protein n=1 Tax=Amblyomma americanum TaxID=6943 RepID=A0AAQ4DTF6_AMBAM